MNLYHKNPRRLTEKQANQLKRDLAELGDLSGIVHDINSDEIIGGNQRSSIMNINQCEIEITKEYNPPSKTGTIAEGFVRWNNERYSYRKVSWTPKQCEKANIVANKDGGTWDFEILANEYDVSVLVDSGFEEWELGLGGGEIDEESMKKTENECPKCGFKW